MPNMSRHLFYSAVLLLLVVMMCCGSGGAAAAVENSDSVADPNFEWRGVTDDKETVDSWGVCSILKVGNDVFAVAEAQCKERGEASNIFTGIASQLLTEKNDNTPVEVMNEAKKYTQVLKEGTSPNNKKVDVSRPTTVVKESDIYMLVGKYSQTAVVVPPKNDAEIWGFLLVKGEVSDKNNKRIKWSDANAVPQASVGEQLISWTELIGSGGSGIETEDGTLVFPVQGTKKENKEDGKTVSLLIYTLKDANSWKLSNGMSADGCSDPSVVEWKDKKLIMMTACDDGRRRVYESADKGDSWTEALGTLSRVWSNKKGEEVKAVRSGFTTATIGDVDNNRDVMLVTLPVYSEKDDKKEDNGKSELHLWLTDNTHIVDIGPVSDDDAAASSLLYKSGKDSDNDNEKEELIALYEKKKGDEEASHSLWSVRLTAQLQRVKDVLATWKKVDDLVSELSPLKKC
ncbi:trans-sialidase [Trypanosoma cruzi]|nr:trans-sialidase [Trypanosoma cruzi]